MSAEATSCLQAGTAALLRPTVQLRYQLQPSGPPSPSPAPRRCGARPHGPHFPGSLARRLPVGAANGKRGGRLAPGVGGGGEKRVGLLPVPPALSGVSRAGGVSSVVPAPESTLSSSVPPALGEQRFLAASNLGCFTAPIRVSATPSLH